MPQYRFTLTAVFDADDEAAAWDNWTEWLTTPSHVWNAVIETWKEVE